jgi:O-antigen biosynthesis protein WbqP
MIKRIFDISIVLIVLIPLMPLLIMTYLMIIFTSKGPALYWSQRVGQNNQLFNMPKFRSMQIDAPQIATHLMNEQNNPSQYLTPVGSFIRKTSLDELPQLWSVLKGDMAIVGPRPALFNQDDLITLRTEYGVDMLKPGITGWAQVNGRDEVSIPEKVALDTYYLKQQSFKLDCHIIFLTAMKVIKRDNVSH